MQRDVVPVSKNQAPAKHKYKNAPSRKTSKLLEQQPLFSHQFQSLRRASGKRISFGWYGGKFSHLNWLLPLLPPCHHYCEPFGGSAAVLLNRAPSPIETYNDLDSEVVNFFRVLRDQKEALIQTIGLTPFSRQEFLLALSPPDHQISDRRTGTPILRAGSTGKNGTRSNCFNRPMG